MGLGLMGLIEVLSLGLGLDVLAYVGVLGSVIRRSNISNPRTRYHLRGSCV